MNDPTNISDVLVMLIAMGTILAVTWLFLRNRNQNGSEMKFMIAFDNVTRVHIREVKQRCEHKDEIEVVRHALATYDVLTQAVAEGNEIIIVHPDGEREKIDLFPIKDPEE